MSEREMTVEQQTVLGDIRRDYGCASQQIDGHGVLTVIDDDGDRWQIDPSGIRSLALREGVEAQP